MGEEGFYDMEEISLKEFFTTVIAANAETTKLRFDALDKALNLSREEMERRLERLNELRDEVTKDRASFVVVSTCDGQHKSLREWRDAVNHKLTSLETRAITWTAAVGLFFLMINLVMRYYGK